MLVHIYNEDDVELGSTEVKNLDDMRQVCREQAGVGNEDWTIRKVLDGVHKAVSSGGHILWFNCEL